MYATQTESALVEILDLGPRENTGRRIGYWRSVPGDGRPGPTNRGSLGVVPLVKGGPYAHTVKSAAELLSAAEQNPFAGAVNRTNVGGRYIAGCDVLGFPPEASDMYEAGREDDAHRLLDGLEFTHDQLVGWAKGRLSEASRGFDAWTKLPWPGDYLDAEMAADARERIVNALASHPIVARYCGNSASRLTSHATCGGCERSNGEWVWPVGLAHYVLDHGLALDPAFLVSIGA